MKAKIWTDEKMVPYTEIPVDAIKGLLEECGFTVLHTLSHYFLPQGETFLYLLSESHFALHSFPEEDKMFIQLSSCNKLMFLLYKRKIKAFLNKWYQL